ncbi:MAG: hypothetical protein HUJ60_06030 [Bacilli bacterium]|nr:hypothetical protein [Bacilli bacterium]
MSEKELNRKLLLKIPEFTPYFQKYVEDQDGLETGSHIVFEDALVPFVIDSIEKEKDDVLKKAFDFFEEMAGSQDEYEQEVLQLSLLEPLKINYDAIYDFSQLMGRDTFEIYRKLELR